MDYNMPLMDGSESSLKIKEYLINKKSSKIPYIICVTANHIENLKIKEEEGIDKFISKPITLEVIKQEI